VFWQIPYDKRVRQGTHFGQPISVSEPTSAVAKSFADLATVISGGRPENGRKPAAGFKWIGARAPSANGNQ
jgi:MinD-like ATPase involved in chromosome partitioning or flagellar assembly